MMDMLIFFAFGFLLGMYTPLLVVVVVFLFLRKRPEHAHKWFPVPDEQPAPKRESGGGCWYEERPQ